jgi:hypothetical protein
MQAVFPGLAAPSSAKLDINIHVSGELAIGPQIARQRVTRFTVSHIGNLLCGGEPELVVGQRFSWRVPVMLTSPRRGIVGRVGELHVDAQTGELDVDETLIERIQRNARALAVSSSLSAE